MSPDLLLRGTIWVAVLAWAASELLRRTGGGRHEAARAPGRRLQGQRA